jgi:hypothetical protein
VYKPGISTYRQNLLVAVRQEILQCSWRTTR